ncbi:MAG: DNA-binding transcriptional LysR family regulator [Verrucomicrobiales bacterium]|jgi:DNA-binding transcriptional LysR family regulator
MQVETLKVYSDLIDTASFSLAAKRNGITQSAVSQQIRALETKFEAVLIERGKKNFSMTPEGKVFLDASKEILELYNGIQDRFHELQNKVAGTLRVATVFSLGLHELPPFVKEYRRLYPSVDLKIDYIRSSQVYTEVIEGNADLGIVAYPTKRKGVTIEEFAQDKMVVICPPGHPLTKRKTARFEDLADQKFVSFEPDLPTRKALDKALKSAGVIVQREMEFDNIETVKRAVEIENGISIVPSRSVENEVKSGRLVSVEIRSDDMMRPLGLVQKRTRATSPAMREFIALLKKR